MLRAFHHVASQKLAQKVDVALGVALGVASRNENCVNFYRRYESFETFQEVLSGFAIYEGCIATIVKRKEPSVAFFSRRKSEESSNNRK